jgi:hypothetical protein
MSNQLMDVGKLGSGELEMTMNLLMREKGVYRDSMYIVHRAQHGLKVSLCKPATPPPPKMGSTNTA